MKWRRRRNMKTRTCSRRTFLKTAGVTISAAALTACSDQPSQASKPEIETPTFKYGTENTMNQRILIAYATRTGSTVDVAAAIGEKLSERGFTVDVKPIKDKPTPEGYQAVVIGSAINGAQWLPEAVKYVEDHQNALKQTPVALFCVHIMNLGDDESSKKKRLAYLNKVRALIDPVDEGYFAGMGMDPEEQSGFIRWFYRTFKVGPEGDCRNWDDIRGWAETTSIFGAN
jgi:menaquinone-dependent protoporphyrinogen oxidase